MRIALTPIRRDDRLDLAASGDVLTINGKPYDFGPIPEGGLLPREAVDCEWLASDVERVDGDIHLTLILPHGPDAPEETRFPEPIHVTNDGPIDLPPFGAVPEEPGESEEPADPEEPDTPGEPVEGDEEGETDGD